MAASHGARNAARLAEQNAAADEGKPERVRRTPAERAQARLDAAKKRLAKATARRDKVVKLIDDAEKDVVRAQREVDFRLTDEDLPGQPAVVESAAFDEDVADEDVTAES